MHTLLITKNTVCDGKRVKAGDVVETNSLYLYHTGKAELESSEKKSVKGKTNRAVKVKELKTRDD